MTRDEALSRLLAGDLSAEDAALWRDRIAKVPEVAQAWARLQQLNHDLSTLPTPEVSAELVAQAVAGNSGEAKSRAQAWPAAVAVLAAALLVWVLAPQPHARLALVQGEQHVVGDVRLLAGGLDVHIDGDAKVFVEPAPGSLRASDREDPMNMGQVVSFGAGVLVTVAVSQGVAWVSGPKGDVTVQAGQTRSVLNPAARRAQTEAPVLEVTRELPDPERIEALEEAVAELTFERDALRGQVAVAGGSPIDWPSGLSPAFQPDQFEATLRKALADADVDIAEIDCSEYPCLAVLDPGPTDDTMGAVKGLVGALKDGLTETADLEEMGMGVHVEAREDGEGPPRTLVGVALGDGDLDPRDPRIAARFEGLMAE